MTQSKHTPGPWKMHIEKYDSDRGQCWLDYKLKPERVYIETDQENGNDISAIIASLSPYSLSELSDKKRHKANARLIAAAPELLEALNLATNYLLVVDGENENTRKQTAAFIELMKKARGQS